MTTSVLRTSKATALASAVLLALLAVVVLVIREGTAHDSGTRWAILPVASIYMLLGGILWVVGSISSRRAQRTGEPGARRLFWLNQLYPVLWGLLFGWALIQRIPQVAATRAASAVTSAKTDQERFYALNEAAKKSFAAGNTEDARAYANELLALLPKFQHDWNYGNAVQDANLVLGRINLVEGRVDEAKERLLAAGRTPGSPQLSSFGPNMGLAKDLLEKGERDVVLEYLDLCRKFWESGDGELDTWAQAIKSGQVPEFGANLDY